jgi:hypothetical protein
MGRLNRSREMEITNNCSLEELARRIGNYATYKMAEAMRALLIESGYDHTEQVPEPTWHALVERAVDRSLRQNGNHG